MVDEQRAVTPDRTDDGAEYGDVLSVVNQRPAVNPQSALFLPRAAAYLQATAVGAANAAAFCRWDGEGGRRHSLAGLIVSYSAAPTGGRLHVSDGQGNILFDLDVTTVGPHVINFTSPLVAPEGASLVVTLAAGGAGVIGKINPIGYRLLDRE